MNIYVEAVSTHDTASEIEILDEQKTLNAQLTYLRNSITDLRAKFDQETKRWEERLENAKRDMRRTQQTSGSASLDTPGDGEKEPEKKEPEKNPNTQGVAMALLLGSLMVISQIGV
jgi:hypothetical protein